MSYDAVREEWGQVRFIQCYDDDCTGFSNVPVDGASDNGVASVAVASDGTSYIVYDYGYDMYDDMSFYDEQGVGLATCNGGGCSTTQIAPINVFDSIGAAITIGADGNPVIVYEDSGNTDPSQGNVPDSVYYYPGGAISSDGSGGNNTQDVAIGTDGFARIAFVNAAGGIDFILCTNASCSTNTVSLAGTSVSLVSVAVGPDGNARIAAGAGDGGHYIRCTTASCSKYSDQMVPDNSYLVSLALDVDVLRRYRIKP